MLQLCKVSDELTPETSSRARVLKRTSYNEYILVIVSAAFIIHWTHCVDFFISTIDRAYTTALIHERHTEIGVCIQTGKEGSGRHPTSSEWQDAFSSIKSGFQERSGSSPAVGCNLAKQPGNGWISSRSGKVRGSITGTGTQGGLLPGNEHIGGMSPGQGHGFVCP